MIRAAGATGVMLSCLMVIGCATTADTGPTGRSGMDRVSPVRAAEVNTRLGIGYFERDQLQVAVEKLNTALEHDDAHVPAHVMLAVIYEQLGDDSRAERHFRTAARHAPEDGATLNSYGTFLCRQGEYEKADEHFNRATEDPFYESPEVPLTNAGACARRHGDLERAERYLRDALTFDSQYPDALFQLARIHHERGDYLRARAFLQRFEATGELHPEALLLGYRIESSTNNPAEANEYRTKLENQFSDSSEARELRQRTDNDD